MSEVNATTDAVGRYRALRDRVDRASGRLVDLHCKHIACRPGCHDCCTAITVSPVEYHAILGELREAGVTAESLPFDPAAPCPYLRDGLCGLYRLRPIICRTHGLPVAFLNEDEAGEEGPPMSVSFCPKNFTEADEGDLAFGPDNTLNLDELNAELADINEQFREEKAGRGPSGDDRPPQPRRIPLSQLRQDLA